ncbi:MAG: HTH-type transcriptional regulator [Rhodospirillales bacterium]|jgi:DNA-binding transcriptional LysR family regulator|nr:HTH-type transcriptional regulator [Rhodospirillales bacterium]
MDTELARTFLEIVATKSFIRAAERLNVAQTTVSARIRILEEQLGRTLFVRNKAGASLTAAGEQFLRYAPTFVQLWQHARQQVAVPPGHRAVLVVGGETSLWAPLLLDWVLWMRRSLRDVAIRVQVDVPEDLIKHVAAGMVDVAIMYSPQSLPGLKIDLLMEEELVLVSTHPGTDVLNDTDYVHIDWGPDFAMRFGASYPDAAPSLFVNLGPLALGYVLSAGGSGYFRKRAIQPHIDAGELHIVSEAPGFSYPIYVVRSANSDDDLIAPALAGLRTIAAEHRG